MNADRPFPLQQPHHSRYPGVRPFSDSHDDQARFFGRERETEQLYLRVLSVNLLVQFGKSGLGKTSLLQAGLFPRLRTRPYLPVLVRLNAPEESLAAAVRRSIEESCVAEGLDFRLGEAAGVWELLTTSTMWRGDLLLTPVLVFDQFEEVFTLRDAAFRKEVAEEIGALATGVPPPRVTTEGPKAKAKVVISLREDYLGALEELSASIPGLFQERLRLEPFSAAAARQAISRPARLVPAEGEEAYTSPRFELEPAALEATVDYLKGRSGVIEPFQLQLLCRHAETIATRKAGTATDEVVTLTTGDFASAQSFASVLTNFYRDTLASIPSRVQRKRTAAFCEQRLLLSSGRRTMCEEGEALRDYGLTHETLMLLGRARVLTREPHMESVFYEISHDRLAESIFETRHAKIPKWVGQVAAAAAIVLVALIAVIFFLNGLRKAADQARTTAERERRTADQLIAFLLGDDFLGKLRDTGRSDLLEQVDRHVTGAKIAERDPCSNGLKLRNLGDLDVVNGRAIEAVAHYRAALNAIGADSRNVSQRREIARTHERLASALADQSHASEALAHYSAASNLWRSIIGGGVEVNAEDCVALANALRSVADQKVTMAETNVSREIDESFLLATEVLFGGPTRCGTLKTRKIDGYPDAGAVWALSHLSTTRADAFPVDGQDDSAAIQRLASEARRLQPLSVNAREYLIETQVRRGRDRIFDNPGEALTTYTTLRTRIEELQRWNPDNEVWRSNHAFSLLLISEAIVQCNKNRSGNRCAAVSLNEAEAMVLEALGELRVLEGVHPTSVPAHMNVVWALQDYAAVLNEGGRPEASLRWLREAQSLYLSHASHDESDIASVVFYSRILNDIAENLASAGRPAEGWESLRESNDRLEKLLQARPRSPILLAHLWGGYMAKAELLRKQGRSREAEEADGEAKRVAKVYWTLSASQQESEKVTDAEAQRLFDEGIALRQSNPAAALTKLSASETAMRRCISYRPGDYSRYHTLYLIYAWIADTRKALKDVTGEGAALRAAMNAAQLAAWLSDELPERNRIALQARTEFAAYLYNHGQADAAEALIREAIAIADRLTRSTKDPYAYNALLGQAQYNLGQIRRGLNLPGWQESEVSGLVRLDLAATSRRTDPTLFRLLGDLRISHAVQLEQGGYLSEAKQERERAIQAYRRTLELDPNDATAREGLRQLEPGVGVGG